MAGRTTVPLFFSGSNFFQSYVSTIIGARVKIRTPITTPKKYDQKKKVQSSGRLYFLNHRKNHDPKKKGTVKNQVEFMVQQEWVDVGFCGNYFPAKPTSTHTYCKKAIRVSRCRFWRDEYFARQLQIYEKKNAKPTSTHIYCKKAIRVSRCRFGGINTHSY